MYSCTHVLNSSNIHFARGFRISLPSDKKIPALGNCRFENVLSRLNRQFPSCFTLYTASSLILKPVSRGNTDVL